MSQVDPSGFIGAVFGGRYRIVSILKAGGMGVALRAWDEQAQVPVVIKVPKKAFLEDPHFVTRFFREIQLLQGLPHPHIVPILDVGEYDSLPYVVMRFLPGGSLADRRLRDDAGLTLQNPVGMLHLWLPAIADALDYVHARGVVHRDVKPANIFFDAFWGAYLGDFGIAKIIEESESFDREHTLTATHMGIGTQEYMGPERFTPRPMLDGRTDQYALAVTIYELLAGCKPFTGTTAHLIVEVTTQPVPPLQGKRHDLPASLVAAVHRGLAKNPAERFATCRMLADSVLQHVPPVAIEPNIVRLLCPQCAKILKMATAAAGRQGKCPKCQTRLKVADDLGALWLLDEARRQKLATAEIDAFDQLEMSDESPGDDINEELLPEFTPVPSVPKAPKAAPEKNKNRDLRVALLAVAAVAAVGLMVWWFWPRPPTYEQLLAQARLELKSKPNSPVANEFVGKHWCFKMKKWEKGLPYLQKSEILGLATLAKRELDCKKNPKCLYEVGSEWCRVAKNPQDRKRKTPSPHKLIREIPKHFPEGDEVDAIREHAKEIAGFLRCE